MRGDQERAYVAFVEASRSTLHGYAWLLTADQHGAEDLLQETFVRVYVKWSTASAQPLAYARRVMSNLHTDRWRSRRREVLRDEVPEHADRMVPDTVDVVRALQRIAPRERECVVLRHYLDLSEKETAAAVGISVGAVKSYTSRGLAAVRPLLHEEERYV